MVLRSPCLATHTLIAVAATIEPIRVQGEGPTDEPQAADVANRPRQRRGRQHRIGGMQPDRQAQREEPGEVRPGQDFTPAGRLPGRGLVQAFRWIPAGVVFHGASGMPSILRWRSRRPRAAGPDRRARMEAHRRPRSPVQLPVPRIAGRLADDRRAVRGAEDVDEEAHELVRALGQRLRPPVPVGAGGEGARRMGRIGRTIARQLHPLADAPDCNMVRAARQCSNEDQARGIAKAPSARRRPTAGSRPCPAHPPRAGRPRRSAQPA